MGISAGAGLSHIDEQGEHQIQIVLPMAANLSAVSETQVSLSWLPVPSSVLIYALAVPGLCVLVDARKHIVLQRIPAAADCTAASAKCNALQLMGLRWSPDGRALSMQLVDCPDDVSGPGMCQAICWGA